MPQPLPILAAADRVEMQHPSQDGIVRRQLGTKPVFTNRVKKRRRLFGRCAGLAELRERGRPPSPD